MKSLILSILCVIVAEVASKKALIFNLETRALANVCRANGDQKSPPCLTACPAFTPQEMQFNQNMSLSKKSLFSRIIYVKDEFAKNIVSDFCEKTVKPVMLFNTENKKYEIGYELYFEEGKVNLTDKTYRYYKPVNTKNPKNYEIMNFTIPSSDNLVARYEEDEDMKFNFTDGSRILVFYWIKVLSLQSSKHQKRTKFEHIYKYNEEIKYNVQDKCENYPSDDDTLYSEEKQKKCLKDIPASSSFNKSNAHMECGHPYGCLEKYQIIPLWYFEPNHARLASCSHMNVIPVWRSIVKQLRKVDLYIVAASKTLHPDITFGMSGALKMEPSKPPVPGEPRKPRKMYLRETDCKNHCKKVPIPKIIYRIVSMTSRLCDSSCDGHSAVIITHNDPAADPKVDKLCTHNESLTGWDRITNDDPSTGLTYVCPMTEELNDELGGFDNLTLSDIEPLNLNLIPYYRSYTYPQSYEDETDVVNSDFNELMKQFG